MTSETLERFVDADEAALFLSLSRRRILDLARGGALPGHPIGHGSRRVWRFLLSEIATAITAEKTLGFKSSQNASMVRANGIARSIAKKQQK